LVHQTLRYTTDAAKAFNQWREDYTGEERKTGDLFKDDIPFMSPAMYRDFFLPYEQELCDFYGGIFYWHSCGDVSKHVSEIHKLTDIEVFDFGVTMENKSEGIKGLNRNQLLELRVMAQTHIQECTEEESKSYIRNIISTCKENKIDKYVIRSSGMSIVKGSKLDIEKLGHWVDLVREVQNEK
jgi:hypothetical protein